jgi:hypothetical protein
MKDPTLLSIFILFFFKLMQQLVEKTKRFTHQYLDMLDKGHIPLPDVTLQETRLFFIYYCADGAQSQEHTVKDYWSAV